MLMFLMLSMGINNISLFIAHWDGWQPFSTSVRGCGRFFNLFVVTYSLQESYLICFLSLKDT